MITITRLSSSATFDDNQQHTWLLKVIVTASSGDGLGAKIFVYHAANKQAVSDADVFEAVASIHQMNEIPADAPTFVQGDAEKCIPYYRLSTLTFDCRSAEEAELLWTQVLEDIEDLAANFKARTTLQTEETVTVATV